MIVLWRAWLIPIPFSPFLTFFRFFSRRTQSSLLISCGCAGRPFPFLSLPFPFHFPFPFPLPFQSSWAFLSTATAPTKRASAVLGNIVKQKQISCGGKRTKGRKSNSMAPLFRERHCIQAELLAWRHRHRRRR
jgi:hypothetical protein